jgi:hypothetical protein
MNIIKTRSRFRVAVVLTIVVAIGAASAAHAQDTGFPGDVPDRFRLRLGSVWSSFDTNFAYAGDGGGLGGLVNFEDLFGIDSRQRSIRFSGRWRVGKRSSIEFGYISFERFGSEGPQRDFQFLGFTILAGTSVVTEFDSAITTAAYRYDAYDNGEVRLYGTAGISYFDLEARLAAGIGVILPNGEPLGRGLDERVDVSQAVPIVGVGADWAVSRRFLASLFIRGLFADLGGFRGGISEVGLSGTWYFVKNLGIGGGFQRTDIRVRGYEGDGFTARGTYSQLGALLFMECAF